MPQNTLATDMNHLCNAVAIKAKLKLGNKVDYPATAHCDICVEIADAFRLWEYRANTGPAQYFPTWLSRVVEGIMADVQENA